jgi:hypothetical protein
MKQVGKGVWIARKQTHKSVETTPLNSAVLPMNSSKIIREWEKHRHFNPKKNGGPPLSAHQRNGLKPENETRRIY